MLSSREIKKYDKNGFLMLKNVFTDYELDIIKKELKEVFKEDCPRKILEKNGEIRSFFAPHFTNVVFETVGRLQRLVGTAMELLKSKVYIHQSKINSKHALLGDWWEWHQDLAYWHLEDGMPGDKVLTAMIFLSDVNEFNGPLLLIPESHREGLVDFIPNDDDIDGEDQIFASYQTSTSYMSNLTSKLKYTLKKNTLAKLVNKNNIFSAKGKAGSVLFFNGLVFHASNNNLSPFDRHTYLITYNSIDNLPSELINKRPDFLSNKDFTPIEPISDDNLCLFSKSLH